MTARVDGEEWSRGSSGETSDRFDELIAYMSRSETLYPGDFIGSGTCSGRLGKGCGLEQGRFLTAGNIVELEVEHIGVLRNRVISSTSCGRPALRSCLNTFVRLSGAWRGRGCGFGWTCLGGGGDDCRFRPKRVRAQLRSRGLSGEHVRSAGTARWRFAPASPPASRGPGAGSGPPHLCRGDGCRLPVACLSDSTASLRQACSVSIDERASLSLIPSLAGCDRATPARAR